MMTELWNIHPLTQLLLKATVLLLGTCGLTVLLRNRSAALRHLLWLCCAMGLLVLPLLTLALPSVKVPVARPAVDATVSHMGAGSPSVGLRAEQSRVVQTSAGSASSSPQANSSALGQASATVDSSPLRSSRTDRDKGSVIISALAFFCFWLAGTALLLAWRFAGDRYLSTMIRRCHPVELHQPAAILLAECATALEVKKPVLLTGDRASMPFTCGLFSAVIVLPEAALTWDAEKLRPVLMHEMAHIKRHDCLTQFVAHCARSLLWFHPLTWWMTRQMHIEREIACDDMVLQTGHRPSRYGNVLLRLATEIDLPESLPAGAIAIAGKSTLERRLLALVDPKRSRRGVTRRIVTVALGLTTLITGSLALPQVVAQTADAGRELAHFPEKLRPLPTERLIHIGLHHPDLPWAWQILTDRARADKLTAPEAESLLAALTESMQRHPYGYETPLTWPRELIEVSQERRLISNAKLIELIQACEGALEPPLLSPVRETDKTFHLVIDWRNVWEQDLFGFSLLNELKSIAIDGLPVEMRDVPRSAGLPEFRTNVQLPPLAPGMHIVRCEILSALVTKTNMARPGDDAPSDTWPPAQARWTRTVETELMVYAKDAKIVRLTEDPVLDPKVSGGLSVERIVVRRVSRGAQAEMVFKLSDSLKVPIGFDVALQVGGRTYNAGHLQRWFTQARPRSGKQQIWVSGAESVIQIGTLAPEVKTANIILTPNSDGMDRLPDVNQIWGKEVVLTQVPLIRDDLLVAENTESQRK